MKFLIMTILVLAMLFLVPAAHAHHCVNPLPCEIEEEIQAVEPGSICQDQGRPVAVRFHTNADF